MINHQPFEERARLLGLRAYLRPQWQRRLPGQITAVFWAITNAAAISIGMIAAVAILLLASRG